LDTKWKSKISIIAWFILFAYGVSGVLTALINDNDYMEKSYFTTSQYDHHVDKLLDYVHAFEISYQSKQELMTSIRITDEEIQEYRYGYRDLTDEILRIEQQYETRILESQNEKDQKAVDRYIEERDQKAVDRYIEERDQKIEEITKTFEDDAYVKEIILSKKEEIIDQYYNDLESFRLEYTNYKKTFAYYLKNTATGEVHTNLPTKDSEAVDTYINADNMHNVRSFPSNRRSYLEINKQPLVSSYYQVISYQTRTNSNDIYEGKIGITNTLPNSHFIMRELHDFEVQRTLFWIYTVGAIIALLISVILEKKNKLLSRIAPQRWQYLFNKIPIDLSLFLLFITVMITMAIFFENSYLNYSNQLMGILEIIIYHLTFITIFFGLTVIQGVYLFRRLKDISTIKKDWYNSLIVRFIKIIRNAFLNRRVGTQVFSILTIVFILGVLLGLSGVEEEFLVLFTFTFILVGLPLFIIIAKRIGYFNRILLITRALANGEFEPDLEIKGKSVLAKLAADINKMKYGVRTSQKAQAKSERLKTELITNVSHDLRTPLTSIMTYSELLKNPELAEDERNSYIEIIDRKSKRLKVLIDDLFEASKMASGNIELVKEKVDIVQLLQQALAEYNETIQESSIQFRVTNPDKPVYALIDGQKLWRVFENLISNILKYSLENTRAYLHVKEEKGQVIVTFKNISKYELSDDIDELFERFKRGDESRYTDGSGLGLAIAKSIIDLHEGSLDIDVDGDLFKITIMLGLLEHKKM
jgi:signal transduction histidine kinase